MNMTDEELQNSVEKGANSESRDAVAYQRVFRALQQEPDFRLPATFASAVMNQLQTAQARSSDHFWLYAGIAACLVTMVIAVVMTGFKFSFGVFQFFDGYSGLIVFALAFIIGLHWLDRRFVRKAI